MRSQRWQSIDKRHGLTLIEVLIAMFILLVGIVGVLAALPTGVRSAQAVLLQDAAIHLAHSKFAEFRRDRVNPATDLAAGGAAVTPYMPAAGWARNRQEPFNSSGDGWRDFAHDPVKHYPNPPYQYFDDIQMYEWRIEALANALPQVSATSTAEAGIPLGANTVRPTLAAGNLGLYQVSIAVRLKGLRREFRFTQYLCNYGK